VSQLSTGEPTTTPDTDPFPTAIRFCASGPYRMTHTQEERSSMAPVL
jgi:hypothetical protein